MKHNVDILKSKSYDKTPILLQSVSKFHILVLPQLRMMIITKIISIYRSSSQGKTSLWIISNSFTYPGGYPKITYTNEIKCK